MNKNLRKFLQGTLFSIIPIFIFVIFVYGSQLYLSFGTASISDAPNLVENQEKNLPVKELEEPPEESTEKINAQSFISLKTNLLNEDKIVNQKNIDLKLPIASFTKLMTAIISLDNYNLSQNIFLTESANLQSPMKIDFKIGDNFTIKNYLYVMLIESSNKAAFALAEQIGEENFVNLMNQKAKEIGLKNTYFADPTGLSSKNVSTINDLVIFVKYIIKNYPAIAEISTIKKYELLGFGEIENTNQLLVDFPEIILSKTGFTNDAKGCLLIVLNNPKDSDYFINIILGSENRFLEMEKLINK